MDVVKMLREQRNAGMVQTVEQYTLIYSVLRDALIDEAHQSSRSAFHFTNSETLKRVAEFDEMRLERSPSPSDTRSEYERRTPSKRNNPAMSSPIPRRADSRRLPPAKKRQIDWESEDPSESSISSSHDMDIDDDLRAVPQRPRRKKLARTVRESPGQEETLLNFS